MTALAPVPGGTGAKHTPGPWRLHAAPYGYDLCIDGISGEGRGGWFVELHGGVRDDDTPEFKAEFEANAHLIAAAPDMLETLQTTRRNIVSLVNAGLPGSMEEWLRVVDAALAKATPPVPGGA